MRALVFSLSIMVMMAILVSSVSHYRASITRFSPVIVTMAILFAILMILSTSITPNGSLGGFVFISGYTLMGAVSLSPLFGKPGWAAPSLDQRQTLRVQLGGAVLMCDALTAYALIGLFIALASSNGLISVLRIRKYPDIAAISEIHATLTWLLGRRQGFDSLATRRRYIEALNRAAIAMESGMPRQLVNHEDAMAQDVGLIFEQCAAMLRSYRKLIVDGTPPAKEKLINCLKELLIILSLGEFEMLPRAERKETAKAHRTFRARKVWRTLRLLMSGFIPILTLTVLKRAGIGSLGFLDKWITPFFILWLIASFIVALDPLYQTKLNTVKNILEIFRAQQGAEADKSGEVSGRLEK